MRNHKFYKDQGIWFIDLPEWEGSKTELQMVCGADTALDFMSGGKDTVTLAISEQPFDNADELEFIEMAFDLGNGAYYKLYKYGDIVVDLTLWLCDVTLFVLKKFPQTIYIKKLTQ